jgi:hypothetical protein
LTRQSGQSQSRGNAGYGGLGYGSEAYGGQGDQRIRLILPNMQILKFLEVDSYHISISRIRKGQFPELVGLNLDLKYGNDDFYVNSMLHPLTKLKLRFHETPIMRSVIPGGIMDSLFSKDLRKLELVNPPPSHLTFMSNWAQWIETLVIAAPRAYGEDPTYPTDKVLWQLTGDIQLREGWRNDLTMLRGLKKLAILLPINESLAEVLAEFPQQLWQLTVDDGMISETGKKRMRNRRIYLLRKFRSNPLDRKKRMSHLTTYRISLCRKYK